MKYLRLLFSSAAKVFYLFCILEDIDDNRNKKKKKKIMEGNLWTTFINIFVNIIFCE